MNPRWLGVSAFLLLFAAATVTQADPDLWGHVRFGLDVLQSREIPSVDPYSFTQDQPWINHEWLSEAQMGLAYLTAGGAGLALLKGVVVATAWLVILGAWRGVHLGSQIVLLAAVVAGTARLAFTLRPQLWSLLLFAVLCRILTSPDARHLRWTPPMFALWANLHGGWILGLGVVCAWWGAAVARGSPNALRGAAFMLASAAATILTPFGWDLWTFIAATVRLGRDISEWQPVWTTPIANWFVWGAGLVAAIWVGLQRGSLQLPQAVVLAMLAFASWQVERLVPFFVVASVVFGAEAARASWPAVPISVANVVGEKRLLAGLAVAAVVAAVLTVSVSLACIPVRGSWVPDPVASEALRSAVPGRIVTFFDWGQYSIWHFGPRLRVSMDGRRETVYSDRRLAEHQAILEGTPAGLLILSRWNAEYVWLPASSARTREWLAAQGYRMEVATARSFVAVRPDVSSLQRVAAGVATRNCFPD